MPQTTCMKPGAPKACPKKKTACFYISHSKAGKASLGPFMNDASAEYGHHIMRSAKARAKDGLIRLLARRANRRAMNNKALTTVFHIASFEGAM